MTAAACLNLVKALHSVSNNINQTLILLNRTWMQFVAVSFVICLGPKRKILVFREHNGRGDPAGLPRGEILGNITAMFLIPL